MLHPILITPLNLADQTPLKIPGPLDSLTLRLGGLELPEISAIWRDYVAGTIATDLGAGMSGQLWESVELTPAAGQRGQISIITSYSDTYDYPGPLTVGPSLIPRYTAHIPWASRYPMVEWGVPFSLVWQADGILATSGGFHTWLLPFSYILSATAVVLATGEEWKINTILTWDTGSGFYLSPNLIPPLQNPLTTAMSIWLSISQFTSAPVTYVWTLTAGGWPYTPAWQTVAATANSGTTPTVANPWINAAGATVALTHIRFSEL